MAHTDSSEDKLRSLMFQIWQNWENPIYGTWEQNNGSVRKTVEDLVVFFNLY